ncbi:hypothetical protein ACFO5K_04265 [Nocardia halotolerans]|uniref:Uncharacterized protein n=1 Tax=Nocardia halotolerans TaxID=1755878 RepID=A0ABV8VF34_9NOCA
MTAQPWNSPEPGSIWEITGTYTDGGTFTDCLAMVWPYDITEGHVLFSHIAPALASVTKDIISPDMITRARRLVLVHADNPRTAYYLDDQDLFVPTEEATDE